MLSFDQGIPPQALDKVSSEELKAFIMLCITHDADKRPEARQLLKHPFFDCVRMSPSHKSGNKGDRNL